jgi:hypothetical protein
MIPGNLVLAAAAAAIGGDYVLLGINLRDG